MFCLRRDELRLRTSLLQSVLLRLRLLDLLSGLDIELIRIAVDFSHALYRGILLLFGTLVYAQRLVVVPLLRHFVLYRQELPVVFIVDRLEKIFKKVDGNKRTILASLLQNAAFMKITLEDLQESINAEGVTDEYQNGANQHGIKQSATLQGYNALIKNNTKVPF